MFAKIFSQIYDGSLREIPEARFTFMDMLILADQDGVVDMTHEAIAARTNRPIEVIRQTISELENPDPRSRTPDHQGKRLARLDAHRDWGWLIVNYEKFRCIASSEQRREKTRARVARFKAKKRSVTLGNASVTPDNAGNGKQKHKQRYKQKQIQSNITDANVGLYGFEKFWREYPSRRRYHKEAAMSEWSRIGNPPVDHILHSLRQFKSRCRDWDADGGKYIPRPAKWLAERRWTDYDLPKLQSDNGSPT